MIPQSPNEALARSNNVAKERGGIHRVYIKPTWRELVLVLPRGQAVHLRSRRKGLTNPYVVLTARLL